MSILTTRLMGWYLACGLCLAVTVAQGATYYIDFQAGNDSSAGTSSGTAWKTIPGTRNSANTVDVSTRWGASFSSSLKVPPGTVFKLRSGTNCGTNNGCGMVIISSAYYSTGATFANPILFQRDPTWGSGSVVFDGNGVLLGSGTGWGLLHVTVGGISFDGVAGVSDPYDGIIVKNSDRIGISYYANALTEGGTVQYVKFFSCGKIYNATNTTASEGHLFVKYHANGHVANCVFDGNGSWHNGITFSSDNRVANYMVTNCLARNFTGSDAYQWTGIGYKAQNSVVTWMNCAAYNNYKGWDPGENGGDNTYPINYKLVNCQSYSNQFGINFNGPDPNVQWPTGITFSLINCVVYGNAQMGSKIYAGPYNLYMVHNVFDGNGINLKVGPDGLDDGVKPINAYLYNNVFYKGVSMNILGGAWGGTPALHFTLNADYNAYVQRASEYFCRWSYWNTMPPSGANTYDFSYGANGPGRASGNWYNFYGANATDQPANGCTGHHHCDAHSKGTGATDASLPPFANVAAHDYHLTASYAGVNLTQFPWYVPEMGVDRAGVTRTAWDIGAFEAATAPAAASISITPASQSFGSITVGTAADRTFTVQNTGGGTLTGSASVTAPFSVISGSPYTLGAGLSQTVAVRYSPTVSGTNSLSLSFTGGAGATATVSGSAWVPPIVSEITQSGVDIDTNVPGLQVFAGSVVQYSGTASDLNGYPIVWQWIYTVNGGPETVHQSGTGIVMGLSYNYTANTAGNMYIWKLRVSNGNATVESSMTVEVVAPAVAAPELAFQAVSGVIISPFGVVTNSYIYQPLESVDPLTAGRAAYSFAIISAGDYIIQGVVNAFSNDANSFYVNIDAEPQTPAMIWDIPVTSGFETRVVSWRGNGTVDNNQFVPKIFNLSQGAHQLIIRGSEANVQLERIVIVPLPPPPNNFRIVP